MQLKSLYIVIIYLVFIILYACETIPQTHVKHQTKEPLVTTIQVGDIRIRDPYIVVDSVQQTYFMYAQMRNRLSALDTLTDKDTDLSQGVEVYKSKDLQYWTAPQPVLELADNFWARKSVWAPEVHSYQGNWYLFVTLTADEKISETPNSKNGEILWKRGTHIFRSDSLSGPFEPLQNRAHTPPDWMSLDGTLYVENEKPYMVFCHEWTQTYDGAIEAIELSPDLSTPIGKPRLLFRASEGSWVRNMKAVGIKRDGFVTDGVFFHKNKKDELIMIWSSFGTQKYAIGQAVSTSGSLFGPWRQIDEPVVKANGGHGMLFRDLQGRLQLAFHQPNSRSKERLHLTEVIEDENGLLVLAQSKQ